MNNIVIGLGGTGGKIINKLKHKLYEKDDVPVDYLYIDSNFDLVDRDKHLWKAFGNDISLKKDTNTYQLTSGHLKGAFDFNNNIITPKYSSWAGNIENWKDIKVQLQGGDGAVFGNQRRRLGRMLLSGHINNILNRVNFLVQQQQRKTRDNVTKFHICAGLSGGTGSGSFIDILAKLKQAYPNDNNEFILYLFLPEDNPDAKRLNGGNYFANAYAALKELNSLYIGNWIPYDISRLNQKIDLGNNTSYISPTYLITNTNESNCLLDVEDRQPEEMVADFISLQLTNDNFGASVSTENARSREGENENGENIRSRDFFSFGIKRVIYPKEEISKYMIYQVLHKVSLALRFNQWSEQNGYITNANITNVNLLTGKLLKEFKLTPEYLLLGSGILENENEWRSFEEEWIHYIDGYAKNASEKRGLKDKEIVDNLVLNCAKRFNTLYRKVGAKEFFNQARGQTATRVTSISHYIQNYLVSQWLQGGISLPQIEQVINEIIRKLNRQRDNFKQKDNELDTKITKSREEISFWKVKLAKAHLFTNKEYHNTLSSLKEHYIYRTYNEAYAYSEHFLDMLISNIQDFQKNYTSLVAKFKDFSDDLEANYNIRLQENNNDSIEKIYDKGLIDSLLNSMILTDRNRMDSFKDSIENMIDGKRDFTSLVKVFGSKDFIFAMESTINNQLHNVIQHIANTQPQYDIANKNIIKELEDKYGNNSQELDDYMSGLINESKFYLPFDNVELQEVVDNNRIQDHNPSVGYVLYPNINNMPFTKNILTALTRQNQTQLQRGDGLVNELTVFDIQPTFPLRYIQKLKRLETQYKNRYLNIEQGDIDVKIHLEGSKESYKEFLLLPIAELQHKAIYKLFILDALGLILENKQFGLYVNKYKGNQIVGELLLGDEFINSYRKLSSVDDNMVINSILTDKLSEIRKFHYAQKEEKKKTLEDNINNKYDEIEKYYQERDRTKIAFWGKHANLAIEKIKDL